MDDPFIVTARHELVKQETALRLRREMTPTEKTLWQRLRGNRLAGLHFRRQQIIDGFIVDFFCLAAGLALEVDGSIHDRQAEYDHILRQRGLLLLRFPNDRVTNDLPAVLWEIATAAHKRLRAR